uniref:ATP synthase complex subunit 8 n=1 Tax=Mahanarva spectabilis TaxID=1985197 RepID=A0A343YVJ4_9HEMI|nr:ATP synthase F0 subunit 8 [Mahanarva spectabilis]
MPQMAPTWWLTLFLFFILSFLMFNMMMYFNMNFKKTETSNLITMKQKNWKW